MLSRPHTLASFCGGQIESDSLRLPWLILMPEICLPGTQVLIYPLHFRLLAFLIVRVLLASAGPVSQSALPVERNCSRFTSPEGWPSCFMRLQQICMWQRVLAGPYPRLLYCLEAVISFTHSLFRALGNESIGRLVEREW